MKPLCLLALGFLLLVAVAHAEEFTQGLAAQDFTAAGLEKLTPAELARLNALIEARLEGKVSAVRQEASRQMEAEVKKRVDSEVDQRVKTELAQHKPSENLLHRMKVMLTPGTEITYATVESTLVGPFLGYQPGTVFTLANGQKWRVLEGNYWSPKSEANRGHKVVIKPGMLGSFTMKIEGAGWAKVQIISRGPDAAAE